MSYPNYPNQMPFDHSRSRPPKRRRWPYLIVGALAMFALLIACGSAAASSGQDRTGPGVPPDTQQRPVPEVQAAPAPQAPAKPQVPATTFGDGMYQVGAADGMAPGMYKTPGPKENDIFPMCFAERLSGADGNYDSVIANQIVEGPGVLTVKKTDKYIKLSGGCVWEKK